MKKTNDYIIYIYRICRYTILKYNTDFRLECYIIEFLLILISYIYIYIFCNRYLYNVLVIQYI